MPVALRGSSAGFERFIGRTLDNLTYREQLEAAGNWVAVEMYSPLTLPLRAFRAVGRNAAECRAQLRASGLDVTQFEYFPLHRP